MRSDRTDIDRRALLKLIAATGVAPYLAAMTARAQDGVTPFEFHVSDEELADLRQRLSRARWPAAAPGDPWAYGTDREFLEELIEYWRDGYDWRAHEAALNAFRHYTTTIEGQLIHLYS